MSPVIEWRQKEARRRGEDRESPYRQPPLLDKQWQQSARLDSLVVDHFGCPFRRGRR